LNLNVYVADIFKCSRHQLAKADALPDAIITSPVANV
jgi:hypothetical protein